ncbi:MAG: histone [Candidatus Micrarchaeales archaeon]|jgi:histone H3/H4
MPISKFTAKKILKSMGANRISDDASIEFAELLNNFAYSIAKKAVELAGHAGRKTVKKADVQLAR